MFVSVENVSCAWAVQRTGIKLDVQHSERK